MFLPPPPPVANGTGESEIDYGLREGVVGVGDEEAEEEFGSRGQREEREERE